MPYLSERPTGPRPRVSRRTSPTETGAETHALGTLGHVAQNSARVTALAALQRSADQTGATSRAKVMQLAALSRDKLNVAGETHDESGPRRAQETRVAKAKTGSGNYWQEGAFLDQSGALADPVELRYDYLIQIGSTLPFAKLAALTPDELIGDFECGDVGDLETWRDTLAQFYVDDLLRYAGADQDRNGFAQAMVGIRDALLLRIAKLEKTIKDHVDASSAEQPDLFGDPVSGDKDAQEAPKPKPKIMRFDYDAMVLALKADASVAGDIDQILWNFKAMALSIKGASDKFKIAGRNVSNERSEKMHAAATGQKDLRGVWKIGQKHASDLNKKWFKKYNLLSRADFNNEMK